MNQPVQRKLKFTRAAVDKLALPAGETDFAFYDENMPGFGIRFRTGGTVGTFFVQYAIGKKHRHRRPIPRGCAVDSGRPIWCICDRAFRDQSGIATTSQIIDYWWLGARAGYCGSWV